MRDTGTDIPATHCPYCSAIFDAVVPSEGEHEPRPGMFLVCGNCASLLRFTETLSFEKCDVHKIPNIPPAVLARVRAAQAALKAADTKGREKIQRELDARARRRS